MDIETDKKFNFSEGEILLINKPYGWTSFYVIRQLRKICNIKKIGHSGTLDPLATGLLLLCTGKFTKKLNQFIGFDKEYIAEITLGATTSTYDLESEPQHHTPYDHLTTSQIEEVLQGFVGNIQQLPPMYSAIKKDGKPLYKSARQGIKIQVEPRNIHIYSIRILDIYLPKIKVLVYCSSGTYIRSLAFDIGAKLGVGGYLSNLERTKMGDFFIQNAWNINELEEAIKRTL
ncbi:MAG: tRNA pseudouridine(55) synthase TruB [Chitinophagaceae bacterium]